ncbi:unnamed protein product [Paramecium sonneborni]|uniref:Transmembrane protein n=1 Tax=Paramecium sonneborni TaxID=65129 RepID=A0A8S1RG64_9CILI|nr:unnamed protein product [Paramecium sonneborni]
MKNVFNTIVQLDVFGVPINLLTNEKESPFKSKVGGLITLIASGISFAYFLYIILEWTNNQIPPNISFKQETIGYSQFHINEAMIQLILLDFSGDQNNIVTPKLYTIENTTITDPPITLFSSGEYLFTLSLTNITLVLNHEIFPNEDHQKMKQYLLIFEICSNNTLNNDSYCADQNVINDYVQKFHGFLFLTIKLNQLNQITREMEQFNKQYSTSFDISNPQYSQVMLKQQETIIDDGFLFNNYHNYQFINNYELIHQQVDSYFASKFLSQMLKEQLNFTSFGCYLFRLDNISIKELVTMPKLGQILAQVGSIVQVIFLLKYIALFYNNKLLENQLLHEIVSMYYPELKNVKLSLFNQYQINEQNIKCTIEDFRVKYNFLLKRAKDKCKLNNILYEISRIQFIIQSQFGDQILSQSHSLGSKLQNNNFDIENCRETNRLTVKPINSIDLENDQNIIEPLDILSKQP